MANDKISSNIYQFRGSIAPGELADVIDDPDIHVVQTDVPAEAATWDLLNSELVTARPDIKVRVYGFYGAECDLSFLQRLGNARNFEANCLMNATGLENIRFLTQLERLSIGIYDLNSFAFLDELPGDGLSSLSLAATASKRPDLRSIARCTNLRTLYVEGHQKNIEVIGGLVLLEDVTLRSLTISDLGILRNLSQLWSLDIKLGGTRDMSGLAGMTQIKYLELWQVKGLSDLDVISTLTGLQFLFLQSLVNVNRLPDFSRLSRLRRVVCEMMNGLTDLSSLASARTLRELFFSAKHGRTAEEFAWLAALPNLKIATVSFASTKEDERFRELAAAHGIGPYRFTPFSFD